MSIISSQSPCAFASCMNGRKVGASNIAVCQGIFKARGDRLEQVDYQAHRVTFGTLVTAATYAVASIVVCIFGTRRVDVFFTYEKQRETHRDSKE